MKSPHKTQKEYFEFAYQTGTDIWTHIPYHDDAQKILPNIKPESMMLDIGMGRGLWIEKLVEMNYRVIGIDYINSIVKKINQKITNEGYPDRARCMVADILDTPFDNNSFDLVTDIGTLQHLPQDQWQQYVNEVHRTTRPHGYFLNISLSRKTSRFLGWNPSQSRDGNFEKFNLNYHFFSESEMNNLCGHNFLILDQKIYTYDSPSEPQDRVALLFTLMQKKNDS